MVEDRGKKPKLSNALEAKSEVIDANLILSVEQLQEIQDELEKINEEASDKVLEVEQKYSVIRKPIYDQRNDIIKSIPDFWLTAFLSHPVLSGFMTADDQRVFKHLTSLEVVDSVDVKSGYSISFYFSPNPYFEDSVLTKSFTFHDEGTQIKATSIKWKEGMVLNGPNHEKKGKKRPPNRESFFSWFSDTQQKEDMDDEEMNDDIADIIKEDLWPNPVAYFNNEDFDEDADEEGKEDEESEDEDDDEEDEDEDELK